MRRRRAWCLGLVLSCACGRGDDRPVRSLPAYDASARPAAKAEPNHPSPQVLLSPAGQSAARVTVQLARTDEQRTRGLMYRQHLPMGAGMLFVFPADEVHSFWMKNTLIPLDMIFITSDMTVAGVVENAEPMTLTSRSIPAPSRYVLEVSGGFARTHGIATGTRVAFEHMPERAVKP